MPALVRRLESVGNLGSVGQGVVRAGASLAQPGSERLAVQELHHQIIDVVLAANVEQRADVRVRQGGGGAGFALETLAG